MEFMRRRKEYEVEYTKSQAKEMLLRNERIAKITMGFNKMTITTHPFIPKGFPGDKLFIYPVGTYIITLKKGLSKIGINIVRKEGYVQQWWTGHEEWYSLHINKTYGSQYGENGICWGSICSEMRTMQRNNDWFWIVKGCLDLINDFKYNTFSENDMISRASYMIDYVGDDENAKREIKEAVKSKNPKFKNEDMREWLFK